MSKQIDKFQEYNTAVARGKQLLGDALRNWVELIQHLREIENSELWKRGPDSSEWSHFGDFLRHEYPGALGFERYRNGVALIEQDGPEFAAIVGIDAAHLLMSEVMQKHPDRREKIKATILDQHKTTGVGPKVDVVRSIAHRVMADVEQRKLPARVASIEESRVLRAENHSLKRAGKKAETLAQEVERLRAKNKRLVAKVKELESKLRKAKAA